MNFKKHLLSLLLLTVGTASSYAQKKELNAASW